MSSISDRLTMLRDVMKREHLAAYIFPSTDPHNGEYVPAHWMSREWISGFNGSAGTAVVTMKSAALWTDSRYFIAAEEQLRGTEFQLMKERMAGTPSITQWLGMELADSTDKEVGLDGMVNACSEVEDIIIELRKEGGLTLRTNFDPLPQIWHDRPSIPLNKVELHGLEYSGETSDEKLERIRKVLRMQHADGLLVTALDDISWILNLRGSDIHCNPVFVSYLLIASDKVTLFIDERKLTAEVKVYLNSIGVDVAEYSAVAKGLTSYGEYNILLDADITNYTLAKALKCPEVIRGKSPVPVMKAVKNDTEIDGFRKAMLKDGIAMVKFLAWLKPAVEKGDETELSVDRKLTALRAEQPLFKELSFDTISAYQEHGAIVHYEPTEETDVPLKPEGFLLLDSGAQYKDGTTDITRTIALGPVTEEQKRIYTLVLKGHIQLELAKFPDGASGTQIDALARECLWREGLNYLHGTGHGVGSFLNVHEGPHQIRMEWKPTPLRAGMIVTDEPGIYLPDRFGVRIENTLLIKHYLESEFGKFLQMEPLTLCPIDKSPIIMSMLAKEEIEWLDAYHKTVFEKIAPYLDGDEKVWLRDACSPLIG